MKHHVTKKLLSRMGAAALAVSLLTGCGGTTESSANANAPTNADNTANSSAQTIQWKLATNLVDNTKTAQSLKDWAQKVYDGTDGALKIDIFFGAQLGAEGDVLQNVQAGSIQIAQMSFSLLAQFNPKWNAFDLPFIFDSKEHFDRFMDTDEAQSILVSFADNDLWVPDSYLMGFRYPNMVKKPIKTVDDFKGVVFRTMDSVSQMAALEALGATPITVPYSDVYNALQTGVAEGWSCDVTGFDTTSSVEVAPYISTIPLFPVANGCVISQKALDTLPVDVAETFKKVYIDDFVTVMDTMYDENIELLGVMGKNGAIINEVSDLTPFMQAVTPVWDQIADQFEGVSDVIEAIDSVR